MCSSQSLVVNAHLSISGDAPLVSLFYLLLLRVLTRSPTNWPFFESSSSLAFFCIVMDTRVCHCEVSLIDTDVCTCVCVRVCVRACVCVHVLLMYCLSAIDFCRCEGEPAFKRARLQAHASVGATRRNEADTQMFGELVVSVGKGATGIFPAAGAAVDRVCSIPVVVDSILQYAAFARADEFAMVSRHWIRNWVLVAVARECVSAQDKFLYELGSCLLYTSPSPRD